MKNMIENPILPGFNPDPSIVRVGDDYYIATSTFEWYPGVQIHHSRNLKDWSIVARPLSRKSQLDMRGNPDSSGVWAPCLTYADGMFWLVYSDVKRFGSNLIDVKNYIVTSKDISGDWSEPTYVNSNGFDASLFHDDDGKKYFLNMLWDHREGNHPFRGIQLQEYDAQEGKLVGEVKLIFTGTELRVTEAPHLYKRNGWYYLLTAEGGTSRDHAMTLARSRNIDGKYELHPNKYIVTTKDAPDSYLQRCGHGDIFDTPEGETFVVFLCGRPVTRNNRCVLGRETALQRAVWKDDDWLYLENGSQVPDVLVTGLSLQEDESEVCCKSKWYDFDSDVLPIDFQWLRSPQPERLFSLTQKKGYLRLFGRETIGSWFEQALVARRQVDFSYTAITCVEFEPECYQQYAGLVCYYNRTQFHYLSITHSEELGRVIRVMSCLGDYPGEEILFTKEYNITWNGPVYLKAEVEKDDLVFSFAEHDGDWISLSDVFDATILSDEGGRGEHTCFTGAFVGMACSDITGSQKAADFSFFTYSSKDK